MAACNIAPDGLTISFDLFNNAVLYNIVLINCIDGATGRDTCFFHKHYFCDYH